jgi:hypothetical protein
LAVIRIQLGDLPPLLAEMVVALLGGAAAAEVVGRSAAGEDPIAAARAAAADLVVLPRPAAGEPLTSLLDIDHLAVLALPTTGTSDQGRLMHVGGSDIRLDRGVLGRLAARLAHPKGAPG